MFKKYGPVFIGTYLSVYVVTLGSIYSLVSGGILDASDANSVGIDLKSLAKNYRSLGEWLGLADILDLDHMNPQSGGFVVAWLLTKFTEPVRLMVSIGITPSVSRFVGRRVGSG